MQNIKLKMYNLISMKKATIIMLLTLELKIKIKNGGNRLIKGIIIVP
jgi:hypothetical protein